MSNNSPKVVGISGGIGSGKSVVSRLLSLEGIPVFDSDREAKLLYTQDDSLKQLLIERWGAVVYPDGVFAPYVLGAIIFNDPSERQWIEKQVHPRVAARFYAWRKAQKSSWVGLESALLYPSGLWQLCDATVWVEAAPEMRLQRIIRRDATTAEEARKRMQAQRHIHPLKGDAYPPCHYLTNDTTQALMPQVTHLLNQLLSHA